MELLDPQSRHYRQIEFASYVRRALEVFVQFLLERGVSGTDCNLFREWAEEGVVCALKGAVTVRGGMHLARDISELLNMAASSEQWYLTGGTNRQRTGTRLGHVHGDRVFVFPQAAVDLLRSLYPGSYPELTVPLASEAIQNSGWVRVRPDGKRTVPKRIDGRLVRVWDLPSTFASTPGIADREAIERADAAVADWYRS